MNKFKKISSLIHTINAWNTQDMWCCGVLVMATAQLRELNMVEPKLYLGQHSARSLSGIVIFRSSRPNVFLKKR